MFGKNNRVMLDRKNSDHVRRYAIKRLSVGVASVAVAGFLIGGHSAVDAAETSHAEDIQWIDESELKTEEDSVIEEETIQSSGWIEDNEQEVQDYEELIPETTEKSTQIEDQTLEDTEVETQAVGEEITPTWVDEEQQQQIEGDTAMSPEADDEYVHKEAVVTPKRVYSIDAGRRSFTTDEVKHIIDKMSELGYTDLHLLLGNDGFRFFLDDMSVTTETKTYTDEEVREGLIAGNKEFGQRKGYKPAGGREYFTQDEMDELMAYSKEKDINIIPGINSPGHMDAIVTAMEAIGIEDARFTLKGKGSNTTLNLASEEAVAFTKALTKKYIDYFKAYDHVEIFNFGADEYANDLGSALVSGNGFDTLIANDLYDDFIQYLNDMAAQIKDAGLRPMVFNDGIYYNKTMDQGDIDTDILVSFWTSGWNGYNPASASFLVEQGFDILNTNDNWYFVMGRHQKDQGWYSLEMAKEGMDKFGFDDVLGQDGKELPTVGSMVAFWADEPGKDYVEKRIDEHLELFAEKNADAFSDDKIDKHSDKTHGAEDSTTTIAGEGEIDKHSDKTTGAEDSTTTVVGEGTVDKHSDKTNEAENVTNVIITEGATPAEGATATLPQTGFAAAGLGLGLAMTGIGAAFSLKKKH